MARLTVKRMRRPRKLSRLEQRKYIYSKNKRCGICGHDVRFDDSTIDHIIPLSRGGSDSFKNMQLAHTACNSAKGNHLPTEYELVPIEKLTWIRGIPHEHTEIKPSLIEILVSLVLD
jgi:5-methylcytosine-specific restriction endonuclease McrA